MWNEVGGLQSLTSLGQLIPFILGVGGLVKVVWGKACSVWRGDVGIAGAGEEGQVGGGYEVAMARYLEVKDKGLDGRVVRAATV